MMTTSRYLDLPDGLDGLTPVRKMDDPYKPCWCGSGKKWKWCHKDRESMAPVAPGKIIAEMFDMANDGLCLHPDAPSGCGDRIIRAHTVQKQGGLKAIAENGHVLSLKDRVRRLQPSEPLLQPVSVGVTSASTFMGFCNRHDTELFRPVEHGDVLLDDRTMMLLGFRAFAYEHFAKLTAVRWIDVQRQADQGRPFEQQARIQQMLHHMHVGNRLAVEDGRYWKPHYDDGLRREDYSGFWYHAVLFDRQLPFASSGGALPEYDFRGRPCQTLLERSEDLSQVVFNLTSYAGKSLAMFGWMGAPDRAARRFVQSFATISAEGQADALLRFIFEHIENSFFRPSWWASLPEDEQAQLLARCRNGGPDADRSPFALADDRIRRFPGIAVERTLSRLPTP